MVFSGLLCPVPFEAFAPWLDGSVFALNVLYGHGQLPHRRHLTTSQRQIIDSLAHKICRMFARCNDCRWVPVPSDAFLDVTGQLDSSVSSVMQAESFDLLESSAKVDPLPYVPEHERLLLSDPTLLFAENGSESRQSSLLGAPLHGPP